jgi:transposase
MNQKNRLAIPQNFKESAIKLALESEQPIVQTARGLGINVNTLHT